MTSNVELLPCPFCGARATVRRAGKRLWWCPGGDKVSCSKDGCGAHYSHWHPSEWNTRANVAHATAARDAENEALQAEVARRVEGFADRAEQLEARAERMAEALRRYGRHDADCDYCHDSMHKPRPKCTCGLEALHPTAAQENDDAT